MGEQRKDISEEESGRGKRVVRKRAVGKLLGGSEGGWE